MRFSFKYYDFTGLKKKVLKNNAKVYTISPYHLTWNDDYYYVLEYSERHDKVISFRVDRIATIPTILEKESYSQPNDFDLNEFPKAAFGMFWGDVAEVDLLYINKKIFVRMVFIKFIISKLYFIQKYGINFGNYISGLDIL